MLGACCSKDLISWTTTDTPWLDPDQVYDKCGVFTGCLVPVDLDGSKNGVLTAFYTSVSQLPIHYTRQYNYGSETLSLAISKDSGKTWQKQSCNPILPGPPLDLQVTGWRDPFVASWPSLDKLLENEGEDVLYGIISGGILNKSPTTFLYSIKGNDLTSWRSLGPLFDVGINRYLSRWSGDLGKNLEVTNFITLDDRNGGSMEVIIIGVEGGESQNHPCFGKLPRHVETRLSRSQLWLSGSFQTPKTSTRAIQSVDMTYEFGGYLDHGSYYAANSFWDPNARKQVVFGWVTEDDLPDDVRKQQGWSGALSLPRTIAIQTLKRVVRARASPVESITSFQATVDNHGTFTLRTLQIKPHPQLEKLRRPDLEIALRPRDIYSSGLFGFDQQCFLPVGTSQWEMQCQITVGQECTRVGFCIGHSEDFVSYTKLFYDISEDNFMTDRSRVVCVDQNVSLAPEVAPFTIFSQHDPETDTTLEETLNIRAFLDSSILEVFVNDRTVITTRIYSTAANCFGLGFFAEGDSKTRMALARMLDCQVWDGIGVRS
ncbi:uncharacterized protein BP5553_06087 [Venustampulla echinocandica]|uniref:Uncharacterized protein n=1 Tax=Venustampulla echinocandica TaxID=2656787 RepID=A0A370TMJ9_9HELO|nr:uncharacterized protein BP5553_06087 [Venustampulla echinocandica]RDL36735.1 hypothetical protein BP5553_06087 [Venustampulla echinocandica]